MFRSLMSHFVQMSLEMERKPQRRKEKSQAHPLFLLRRKAQTQEKKGNKNVYFSLTNTVHVSTDWTFSFLPQLLQQQHHQERALRRHAQLARQHFPSPHRHQRPHPGQVPRDASQRAADRR